jgi:Ca2+-binding RTX toxin-like protein
MTGYFTASDAINGGTGTTTVTLNGDYSGGVTFNATTMVNVDTLYLTTGHSYDLVLNADTVANGQSMTIQGNTLVAGNVMTIDASALTAGSSLTIDAGVGTDTLTGGAGTNEFVMRGYLTASDVINGGIGTTTVTLDGDYSAGVTFNATTMVNVSTLFLDPGHSYDLTLNAATVGSGQTMTVWGGGLGAGNNMTIDGSATTAGGTLVIDGGDGTDDLIGGAGSDTIRAGTGTDFIMGGLGADRLFAGSGADTFAYGSVADSTSTGYDAINGFNASTDLIDLQGSLSGVTVLNAAVTTGTLGSNNFDAALQVDIGASQLSAHGAVLFTPNGGGLAGHTFLIIDENGVAGYQAGQDLVIELAGGTNLSSFSLTNFETAA